MNIENSIKEIILKAIRRYAEEHKTYVRNVKINVYLGDEGLKYALFVEGIPIKQITFNDILNVQFDFLARELIISPYLMKGLVESAIEYQIDPVQIANLHLGCLAFKDGSIGYTVDLYKHGEFVARLTSEQFENNFGTEMTLFNEGG
jgi:hypothetical protein